MGGFKKSYYDEGFPKPKEIDKLICYNHVKDSFISNYIKANGAKGKCNYCNKNITVIPFNSFFELLQVGLDYLLEDANESRYINPDGEHGLDGNTFVAYDILSDDILDLRIDSEELHNDLLESLNQDIVYCFKNEFGDETDYLKGEWEHFKETVKHKARFVFYFADTFKDYFNSNPISILNGVQSEILKLNLLKTISTTTKIYRCTQHKLIDDVKPDGKRIASNPSENCKSNNRMSPAGISMFYGSPDVHLCIKEAVDFSSTDNLFYTTAYFTPNEELKLVDLTNLPKISSIFDKEKNKHIQTILFLNDFIADISKPIDPKDSITEYVPTQIVTEYIRFNPTLNVDGIIYPSSKDSSKVNYVLFLDSETSLTKLQFHSKSRVTKKI